VKNLHRQPLWIDDAWFGPFGSGSRFFPVADWQFEGLVQNKGRKQGELTMSPENGAIFTLFPIPLMQLS